MFKRKIVIPMVLSILLFVQLAHVYYIFQAVYADDAPTIINWFLIVGAEKHDTTYHDTAYMTKVLLGDHHVPEELVRYLYADPTVRPDDLIFGNAMKESVRSNITDWLGSVSENDNVFIFIDSHGAGFDRDTGIVQGAREDGSQSDPVDEGDEHQYANGTWYGVDECVVFSEGNDHYYYDDELAEDLAHVNCSTLVVMIQACYSGGFIDDLSNETENRIIITSTNETYPSWFDCDGDGFSEFTACFLDVLHAYNTTWLVDGTTDVGSKLDPPRVLNAYLSIWEAFDYAYKHDTARLAVRTKNFTISDPWNDSTIDESPWYDDDGDGFPTYQDGEDILDGPQGDLGKQTYPIFWTGDVNCNCGVNIFDLVLVAAAYGSGPGDPHWNPDADLTKDNIIDIFDLVMVGGEYGRSSPYGDEEGGKGRGETTKVSMYPDEVTVYRHESLSVNVTIANVTDLYGWEFQLCWNNTVLNCTNAEIYAPGIWGNNTFQAGDGIDNQFNSTHGRFFRAMSALHPASSFNGSLDIVTLTFEANVTGSLTLDLVDTKLSNSTAQAISHSVSDGSVTVNPQTRFMRGDKHTVNGLEAYKLKASQSTSSKTVTKYASGSKTVYWGIRVWKRLSNGTETEITGGTPVAQVSRSSNGQGMQSNTWNCSQTPLEDTDAMVVKVYVKFGSGSWQLCCTFITEELEASQLDPAQWTVYYYTHRYYTLWSKTTSGSFKWGTTTYNSRIANYEYT